MDEPLAVALKFGFLIVLYLFLLWVSRSALRDLARSHEPGTVLDITDGATLGRADSAEIRVDDPYASSAHARIYAYGDFMQLEDMGSTNGTYLNGRRVRGAERLKVADSIRIGDTEWRYRE